MNLFDFFLNPEWLKHLLAKMAKIRESKERELDRLGDIFGPFRDLAPFYVEPNCQDVNPADAEWDGPGVEEENRVMVRLKKYFNRLAPSVSPGQNQMFILSDAGMGKTSLLMMIKLTHLYSLWPRN